MKTEKEVMKLCEVCHKDKKDAVKDSKCSCERDYQRAYFQGYHDALSVILE